MANGTLKRIAGPAYIANAAANIYTPPASTILTVINQIRVSNKTGTAASYTLYVGATGASAGGTEVTGLSESVAANSHVDQYFSPGLRMLSTDFLTGVASAASTLTIVVMGTQSVVD
jgi:hypothetical protein